MITIYFRKNMAALPIRSLLKAQKTCGLHPSAQRGAVGEKVPSKGGKKTVQMRIKITIGRFANGSV